MKFLAMTSRGLVEALENELKRLNINNTSRTPAGIEFVGSWKDCYNVNLNSRVSTRVLFELGHFRAFCPKELLSKAVKLPFSEYMKEHCTFNISAHTSSKQFKDSRYVGLVIKDAICDQFREKFGHRPDIEKNNPDYQIYVRVHENDVDVSINTSGEALFKRGYRVKSVLAPAKEHLAAGLLEITGWQPGTPLVDPMCGSGTFIIEAALKALKMAPQAQRKHFGFEKLIGFDKKSWDEVLDETFSQEEELPKDYDVANNHLFGYDHDRTAIRSSISNAQEAGVNNFIKFKKMPVELLEPECEKGIVIVNPPYGERLDTGEDIRDVYRDLGFILKNRFKGWTCWVLSGHKDLSQYLGMRASEKIPVWNGPIECRFIKYEIRD